MSNKIFLKIIVLFYCIITINHLNANELNPEAKNKLVERANKYRAEGNYDAAIIQLDSILAANPKDAGILLYKGDLKLQSKRFKDAIDVYRSILPLNYEKTIVQINLSYALFMNHHPAEALIYAQKAWEEDKTNNSAIVNHFNAMLWNIQDKKAKQFLISQTSQLSPAQNLVLNARLETTRGNFKKGLELYDRLVHLYPNKHYLMEYTEVLIGKKELKTARTILKTNDSFLSPNELKSLEEKLEVAQQQRVGSELVYFTDVAKNNRLETNIFWQQGEGKPYRIGIKAGNIITTSAIDEKTTIQFGHITLYEKWGKSWKGQTELKVQQIQASDSNHFTAILGEQSIKFQPNDRRMVGVYYTSEMLNFTASLIGQNVRSHNLGYVTHIMLNGKTGIYSQGSWGSLNDNNQRYQFFGSLYRLIRTEPTLKTGINFSALHFTDSKKEGYFAPNRFISTEVFTDYSTALTSSSKYYFTIQAAAGLQKIETQNWDPAFRLQTEVGYRVKHFETSLKYQTSNVAAANGTGYRFNWFTMNLVWKW